MVIMSDKKTLVLIDGNAILHRAYHALPPMSTKDGTLVNAVYGFSSLLLKIMNDIKPDGLVCTFDLAGGTFRDEIYPEYKATREKKSQELYDQLDPIKDVLDAFAIPWFEKEGYEADDIIGSISEQITKKNKDWKVLIVTGDLDELQLVDEQINLYMLKKGISQVKIYDEVAVHERYGLTPDELIDYKAFKGDPSDNIKGVAGIGDKGATQLIQSFGSVEGVYKALSDEGLEGFSAGVAKKVRDGEEDAKLAKELVTIVTDLKTDFDLKDSYLHDFEFEDVEKVFRGLEFGSLLSRVPGSKVAPVRASKASSTIIPLEVTVDQKDWKDFILLCEKQKYVVVFAHKAEQTSMFESGVTMGCVVGDETFVFLLNDARRNVLLDIILNKKIALVGFDVKRLFHVLDVDDVSDFVIDDVMLLEYVLHAGRQTTLANVLFQYADVTLPSKVPADVVGYVGSIVDGLSHAYTALRKEIKGNSVEKVLDEIEIPLLPVLYAMERAGVQLDVLELSKLHDVVVKDIENLKKKMYKACGVEFNISSPSQLKDVLFETLQLPTQGIKKGKTGYSTAASELEKLRGMHPIIEDIFVYRELSKLQSTYIDALPKLVARDGRVHTTFAQSVTSTGRLASLSPNLQNIPMRTARGREVRAAFIPKDGFVLLAADYSQIELRLVAHISKDKELTRIFKEGEDVHTATAAKIHGIPIEKVTKDIRRTAKEVNFGVLYGMGAFGLASRTGISRVEAAEFIENYFDSFFGVKKYVDATIKKAAKDGYVETMFGRRRELPELSSDVGMVRKAGERMAVNMPTQGAQADIIKKAMVEMHEILDGEEKEIQMLLQVHDELVFEVKKGKEQEWAKKIKKVMEGVVKLKVPIIVDVHVGDNWRDMKDL